MNLKKLFSYSTLLMSTISSAFAQCIVAGTDFETNTELCCPVLTSDADGWYNADLDKNELCDKHTFAALSSAAQIGIGGRFFTESNADMSTVDDVFHTRVTADGKPAQYGYSTITAQPKLIHPFFKANKEANNMFVNVGSADNCVILSYTVMGLEPGSLVYLSFTLHNLLDLTYFEHLINNEGVKNMKDYIYGYDYNRGSVMGNVLKFNVASSDGNVEFMTAYNNSIRANNPTIATVEYGDKTVVTHKAVVPESGNITFYFYRSYDCGLIPVGIDDIRVEGTIKPTLSSFGIPCPQQPIRVSTKQNYPEGTMFSWKETVTGKVSTEKDFYFIPDAAETDYSVSCNVTLPGCTPTKSDPYTIHSGTCCTTADGTPMAMAYLFYDDFGNFVSDDVYEWTDRYGVTHTEGIPVGQVHDAQSVGANIPYVKAYNIEESGAKMAVPFLAPGTIPRGDMGFKSQLYDHGVYVVSRAGAYPGGVIYDNSGTTTGGMLQFDLLEDGSQDDFFEMEFDNICSGKEVTFGVDVASISERSSHIEISLERDGSVIASSSAIVNGGSGWKSLRESVVIDGLSDSPLKLKIRYLAESPRFDGGEIAIDNLFLSVCTAPDVVLESNLSAAELLDLCTDIPLTLNTVVSNSALYFYGKNVGFLFQYTYFDPSTTDAEMIDWKDLSDIQQDGEFSISSPAMHPAFEPLVSGMADRIYFRVVVGDMEYLTQGREVWEHQNAFSPCRAVSFSSIPVVAGLNCPLPAPETTDVTYCVGDVATPLSSLVKIPDDYPDAELKFYRDKENKNYTYGAELIYNPSHEGRDTYYVSYVVDDQESELAKIDITVEGVITPIVKPIEYLMSEGKNGFKKPTSQDPGAIISEPNCTLHWLDLNMNEIFESDIQLIYDPEVDHDMSYMFHVYQENEKGCRSYLAKVPIVVKADDKTSLSNATANTVTITPNPASTKISVVAEGVIEKIEILNTVGKVVKVSGSKEINIADMHNGVYFVRTTIDGETSVHRLVVNK